MINYSKTIVFYDIYFNHMVPYLIDPANKERLGITDQQVTDLTGFLLKWNVAYKAYILPTSYGKFTTAQINGLWKLYKAYTDGLKQQIKNNPAVVLTEEDYLMIDIHKDAKPRANIPAPTAQPGVSLKKVNHLNNEYHVFDLADPGKLGKPKDVKRIIVLLLVLAAGAPVPTLDMMMHWDVVGSMNFDIPFTEDQIGKVAYVAVCFSNDSGDGSFSTIISSPII